MEKKTQKKVKEVEDSIVKEANKITEEMMIEPIRDKWELIVNQPSLVILKDRYSGLLYSVEWNPIAGRHMLSQL